MSGIVNQGEEEPAERTRIRGSACICIGQIAVAWSRLWESRGIPKARTVAWRQEPQECRPNVDLHWRWGHANVFCRPTSCPTNSSRMEDERLLIIIMKRYGEYLSKYFPCEFSSSRRSTAVRNRKTYRLTRKAYFHSLYHEWCIENLSNSLRVSRNICPTIILGIIRRKVFLYNIRRFMTP